MEYANEVPIPAAAISANALPDRAQVRRLIHRVLVHRLRPRRGSSRPDVVSGKLLYEKSFRLEDVLYKKSSCLEDHCNLRTLEQRIFETLGLVDTWRRSSRREAALAAVATERRTEAGRAVLGCWRCGWRRRRTTRKMISLIARGQPVSNDVLDRRQAGRY